MNLRTVTPETELQDTPVIEEWEQLDFLDPAYLLALQQWQVASEGATKEECECSCAGCDLNTHHCHKEDRGCCL
ncbi:hypothetical protein GW755_03265 [bacterium]|nr:hypothetical protein [bacterium]